MRDKTYSWARLLIHVRRRLGRAGVFVACRRRSPWVRILFLAGSSLSWLLLLLAGALIHHVYFDRSGLPDLEAFIRFEPPTTGRVYDARGKVLIDVNDNRYLIPDVNALSPREQGEFRRYIYW